MDDEAEMKRREMLPERIERNLKMLRDWLEYVDYERELFAATPREAFTRLVPRSLGLFEEAARLHLKGDSIDRLVKEMREVMEDPNE